MDPIIKNLSTWTGHKSKGYAVFTVSFDGEKCIYALEKTSTLDVFTQWPDIEVRAAISNTDRRKPKELTPAQAAELLRQQREAGVLTDSGNALQRLHEITRRVLNDGDEPAELFAVAQALGQYLTPHFVAPLPLQRHTQQQRFRRPYRPRETRVMQERWIQRRKMQLMGNHFRSR